MWDRSNTSDALLGTARVHITDALASGDKKGWYKLVGTGDQVREGPKASRPCDKDTNFLGKAFSQTHTCFQNHGARQSANRQVQTAFVPAFFGISKLGTLSFRDTSFMGTTVPRRMQTNTTGGCISVSILAALRTMSVLKENHESGGDCCVEERIQHRDVCQPYAPMSVCPCHRLQRCESDVCLFGRLIDIHRVRGKGWCLEQGEGKEGVLVVVYNIRPPR